MKLYFVTFFAVTISVSALAGAIHDEDMARASARGKINSDQLDIRFARHRIAMMQKLGHSKVIQLEARGESLTSGDFVFRNVEDAKLANGTICYFAWNSATVVEYSCTTKNGVTTGRDE